ncbi:MAG: FG-GAP repeat domain-containing protein [Salinibacter sp.]
MRLRFLVLTVLGLGALLLAGCAGASRTAEEEPPSLPGDYRRVVRPPFSVLNASGTPYGNPFYGGFNTPRPQFVDIDGDGDDDLFVQERSDRLAFFEHVTEGDSSRLVWRTDDYRSLSIGEWFRFADLDQDSIPDLLAEQPYSHLRAYRNVGTATTPRFELFADTMRTPGGEAIFSDRQNIPNVTDVDCDGQLDLFLGRLDGTITRYEAAADSAGMPQFAHVTDDFEGIEIVNQQIGVRHGANTLTFADIDTDGDPDLFWGDFFEPGLLLIENTGACGNPVLSGEPEPFPPTNPLETSGYNAPALTDWTGNGRLDLFVGVLGGANDANASLADNFYFYEHGPDGYRLRTRQFVGGIDVGSESSVAAGDLDGNGTPDLLVANKIDPKVGSTSRIYRITGNDSLRAPRYRRNGALDLPSAYHYTPALGDLTGDGAPDLVLGTWKGRIALHRNEGDGTFTVVDDAILQRDGRHATPALGDLTGDGTLDLVVGAADGAVYLYRNTGTPSAPSFGPETELLPPSDARSRSAPALHDVNRDGTLDLLVGAEEGLFVVENTGTPTDPAFEAEQVPVSLDGVPRLAAPAVVDLDGDGVPDLVSGSERGGLLLFQPASER